MPTGQRAAVARRRERGGRLGIDDGATPRRPRHQSSMGASSRVTGAHAPQALHNAGLRSWQLHGASLGAIGLCIGLWIRAKTVDQDERGNAERRALFVGLWPPMLWLIGDSVEAHE